MSHSEVSSKKLPLLVIFSAAALYALALSQDWPQQATELVAHGHTAGDSTGQETIGHPSSSHDTDHASALQAEHESDVDKHAATAGEPPELATVLPFASLLLAIAILPLLPFTAEWWESNLHRFQVAACLAIVTIGYYALLHNQPIDAHWPSHAVVPPQEGLNWQIAMTVFANAILGEYVPFIVLLFSLYTIAGGIRIEGDLAAHPLTNTTFIAAGGLLASLIGTTGAAMLLIRPLLDTNLERRHVRHTIVFFIFVVCNCGGCLLPIGDPPLFLGYLRGVHFFWTLSLWPAWLFVNAILLAMYWAWDHFHYYPRETISNIARDETQLRPLRFRGLKLNVPLLIGVVLAVAFLDPVNAVPGTSWHPWMYLREMVQLGLVALSLLLGRDSIRADNRFNYHAILEVAALFCGIFICMQPALQILAVQGSQLGIDTASEFFWITGSLSSVLDNAPTYVVFFETATELEISSGAARVELRQGKALGESLLIGISLGAVFMGAMTYIGNGPNFMVKSLAEKSGIRMPSFFGYVLYSGVLLLPVLLLASWLFLD